MNPFRKFWKPAPKVSTESTDSHPVRCEALVIEDQHEEADMLCGLLRMQSVQVTWAGNIAGAI